LISDVRFAYFEGMSSSGYVKISRNAKKGSEYFLDPFGKPENDSARAEAMRRFKIFDTPTEEIFSAYTKLAAITLHTPIALMSFVDDDKVFYKESFGVNRSGQKVDRKNSPCTLAIKRNEVSQFRYALTDPCVLADEKKLAEAGYKFYAGAPIATPDGFNIGILAVVDRVPRVYSNEELAQLKQLADEVMEEIEFRLNTLNSLKTYELNLRLLEIHKRVELTAKHQYNS
jgi:hypothetical protein